MRHDRYNKPAGVYIPTVVLNVASGGAARCTHLDDSEYLLNNCHVTKVPAVHTHTRQRRTICDSNRLFGFDFHLTYIRLSSADAIRHIGQQLDARMICQVQCLQPPPI